MRWRRILDTLIVFPWWHAGFVHVCVFCVAVPGGATKVREEEATDFAKAEAEFVDGVDTLDRAIGIIHNVIVCISIVSVQVFSCPARPGCRRSASPSTLRRISSRER